MRILILCDRSSLAYHGLNLEDKIRACISSASNEVETIILNGENINPCLGCFKCWIKTPGLCIQTNDAVNSIAAKEIKSDIRILLSKICYGGYSYDIKSYLDRRIPNISPFFNIINNEMHHERRYEANGLWITIGYGSTNEAEKQCFLDLIKRNTINMQSKESLSFVMNNEIEFDDILSQLQVAMSTEVTK